jgi:anti-sigma regulatory factor (Ser/Thr protein kinase)
MTTTGSGTDAYGNEERPSSGREAWLRMGLAAELPSISAARHTIGRFLELAEVTEEETESLVLVTSELCTNAIVATPGPEADEVVVACRVADRSVEVKVTNRGDRFDSEPHMPEPDADSGRGLSIVDSLTDRLVVRHRAGRTTVTATRHLPARTTPRIPPAGRPRPPADPRAPHSRPDLERR